MRHVLDWSREQRLDRLVLHASAEGRRLYERLGFVATNEMRFAGDLCLAPGAPPGPGAGGGRPPGHRRSP